MSRILYIVNSGHEAGAQVKQQKDKKWARFPSYIHDARNLNWRQQASRNNYPGVDEENRGMDSGRETGRQLNSQEAETELLILFGAIS